MAFCLLVPTIVGVFADEESEDQAFILIFRRKIFQSKMFSNGVAVNPFVVLPRGWFESRYKEPTLVHAVTGAERQRWFITAKVIDDGGAVCLASPRIDVCLELYKRLQNDLLVI